MSRTENLGRFARVGYFSVETDFMVHEQQRKGMMGMGGMWDYPLLGVVVMGTMMVGMWAIGGRVF